MSRSPNLSSESIGAIVAVIAAIEEPVTWKAVIAAAKHVTKATYTRQALSAHPRVADAYGRRKQTTSAGAGARPPSQAMQKMKAAADLDAAEIKALRAAVWEYEELVIRIITNAQALNISEEQLLRPLPPCDQNPRGRRRSRTPSGVRGRVRR